MTESTEKNEDMLSPTDLEEILATRPANIASNVTLKFTSPERFPSMIRSLSPLFCNVSTLKVKKGLFQLDLGYLDLKLGPKFSDFGEPDSEFLEKNEKSISISDFEFLPTTTIVLTKQTAEKLCEQLTLALKNIEKAES